MAIDVKEVVKQADFCLDLMTRLNKEIKADRTDDRYAYGIWYHTRKQGDIIRLRRELNKLNKMLYPWGSDDNG